MIIELNNEIKHEIIKTILENRGDKSVFLRKSFDTVDMFTQLRQAIKKHGYSLDSISDQALTFEIYSYNLSVGGITGYGSKGEWYSFELLYDFNDFTEDIPVVYMIDQNGSDNTLKL